MNIDINHETCMQWNSLPFTKYFLSYCKANQEILKEQLGNTAGEDPVQDRMKVGMIRAFQIIIDGEYEPDSNSE